MDTTLDIFEPGDKTALICIDAPELQRLVIDQVTELGFKIQGGFSLDDILLKIRAQMYDVLVISEQFGGSSAMDNLLLEEAVRAPAAHRQKQFLVLIGSALTTNSEMEAFEHSVDLVVNLTDVVHMRPLLRRALSRAHEFYAPYLESLAPPAHR